MGFRYSGWPWQRLLEPPGNEEALNRTPRLGTGTKVESHPGMPQDQAAAWKRTRAWWAKPATRSGPSTAGSSRMHSSRRAATTGTPSVTTRLGNERSATARALLPTGTVKHRSGRLQAPKGAAAAMGEQLGQAIDLMRPLARISTNLRPDRW